MSCNNYNIHSSTKRSIIHDEIYFKFRRNGKGANVLISKKNYFLCIEDDAKQKKPETVAGYTYECVAIEK